MNLIDKMIFILLVILVFFIGWNIGESFKTDYNLIINKNHIEIKDLKGRIIYSDTVNFSKPNKIEQAIIKDNL